MTCAQPILVPTLDELLIEFERAFAAERLAAAPIDAGVATSEETQLHLVVMDRMVSICGQIAELPAQTFEHIRLKARALDWYDFPEGCSGGPVNDRLTFQLVRALVDGLPS